MKRDDRIAGRQSLCLLVITFLVCLQAAGAAPVVGRMDQFQDGTTMGWSGGQPSYTTLGQVSEGGPQGEGDGYLEVSVKGYHLGTKNETPSWTGDYLGSGVTDIEMDLAHLAENPDLLIRLMLFGPGGTFATDARPLPISIGPNNWTHVSFSVRAADLTYVAQGSGRVQDTLRHVTTLLIRHDREVPTPPGAHPPHINASIGIDNIHALVRAYDTAWTFEAATGEAYRLVAYDGLDADVGLIGTENPTLNLYVGRRYQVTVPDFRTHPLEIIAKGSDPHSDSVFLSMDPNGLAPLQEDPEIRWQDDGLGTVSFTLTDTLLTYLSSLPGQRPGYRCRAYPDLFRGDFIGCTQASPADLNGDCVVTIEDIDRLLEEWLACYTRPSEFCP